MKRLDRDRSHTHRDLGAVQSTIIAWACGIVIFYLHLYWIRSNEKKRVVLAIWYLKSVCREGLLLLQSQALKMVPLLRDDFSEGSEVAHCLTSTPKSFRMAT